MHHQVMVVSPRLQLSISEDGLTATITVPRGDPVTGDELVQAFSELGITAGVDEESCSLLVTNLSNPEFHCKDTVLAVGRPAIKGRDAWFEPLFEQGIQAGHARDDGTVDYHNRDLLKPAHVGDLLAIVHPPVAGTSGLRVDGSPIEPAPASPIHMRFLSGVELTSDGQVHAKRSGSLLYLPDKSIDVVERHVHDGPVDLHSGDLHMQGSLVVKGDVQHSFKVITTGDLDIVGGVEAATVVSGGSVRIQRGVRGAEGTFVHASGSIATHHAQSAVVICGGELTCGESVNSRLVAVEVKVSGRVRGGSVEAESFIVVHEAGAPNGVETLLVAAKPLQFDPDEAQSLLSHDEHAPLSQRGRPSAAGRFDTKGHHAPLLHTPKDSHLRITDAGGPMSQRGRAMSLGGFKATKDKSLDGEPSSVKSSELHHHADLERRREELQRSATIEVALAHPGVTIRIGSASVTLAATVHSMRYYFDSESGALLATKL